MTKKPAAAKGVTRFPILSPTQLSKEQAALIKSLLAGPRGGGESVAAATKRMLTGGPFNAWLRSPLLGERLQKVGEYIRFNSSLPQHLNELAILVTARYWTSQYEWYAHLILALKAGLDPTIAAALAKNKRPAKMQKDEAAVYDFCTQLHQKKNVSLRARLKDSPFMAIAETPARAYARLSAPGITRCWQRMRAISWWWRGGARTSP